MPSEISIACSTILLLKVELLTTNCGYISLVKPFKNWFECITSSNWILGDRSYILAVSVCCVFFPTLVIVASHICILLQIRRTGQMFSNKAAGKQSSKAEIQFIRVILFRDYLTDAFEYKELSFCIDLSHYILHQSITCRGAMVELILEFVYRAVAFLPKADR